jgi:hypothetical protein
MESELAEYINKNIDKNEYKNLLSKGKYISFYGLLKLIDSRIISNFRNELIKYEQAMELHDENSENFLDYHKIINLVMFSADRVPSSWNYIYEKESNWKSSLNPFVDFSNIEDDEDFYYQGKEKIPVVRRQIELARKYGAYSCLKRIYEDMPKVNQEDINRYKVMDIGEISEDRRKMHEQWSKQKDKRKWLVNNKGNYIEKCNEVDEYNFLKNKIELFDLSMIQKLLIEILGKNVGYISLWERDFRFFLMTLDYSNLLNPYPIENGSSFDERASIALFERVIRGKISVSNYRYVVRQNNDNEIHNIISCLFLEGEEFPNCADWRDFRNDIAHLKYLRDRGDNLLEYLENFRVLFKYDRNVKNSITKSFIQIFERNNIGIELTIKQNKIELENVWNRKNLHLNGEVYTFSHSIDYKKLVENLIKLK